MLASSKINRKYQMRRSFTLIELLVVIAIIGLLSTVVMVSVGSLRADARDAKRKADLNQMIKALDLYHLDNSKYPVGSGAADRIKGNEWRTFIQGGCNSAVYDALNGTYLAQVADDPDSNYHYFYEADGKDAFWIASHLENTGDPDYVTVNFTGCTPFTAHYEIYHSI